MIITHKSNGLDYVQVAYKWQGTRRSYSFGRKCKMNLSAAEKYVDQIKQIRTECMAKGTALPVDPPSPKKIPKLGVLIAQYENCTPDDSLPMDLFLQLCDKHRNVPPEQFLKLVDAYEASYKKLIAERAAKKEQTRAKRAATIAARRNNSVNKVAQRFSDCNRQEIENLCQRYGLESPVTPFKSHFPNA